MHKWEFVAPSPAWQGQSSRWGWWWRTSTFICLPHDAISPQEASPLWETCPGSPLDEQSRTWRSPRSPPAQLLAAAPSLLALTHLWRSLLPQSGDPWWLWSPPQPPGWMWSWPSCWNTCALCPGECPSCTPQCPSPVPPLTWCSAGAFCPRAPSGAGTDKASPLWGYLAADRWMMKMESNKMEVSSWCLMEGFKRDPNSQPL